MTLMKIVFADVFPSAMKCILAIDLEALSLSSLKRQRMVCLRLRRVKPSKSLNWLTEKQSGLFHEHVSIYRCSYLLSRSIVNGLRAEDTESLYQRRASFDSEYSYGQPGDGDTEQLFFKEHNHQRTGSKSSNSSHLNRRRSHQAAANRPETKVCRLAVRGRSCTDPKTGVLQFLSPYRSTH